MSKVATGILRKKSDSVWNTEEVEYIQRFTDSDGANDVLGTFAQIRSYEGKEYLGYNIENFKARKARGDLLPHTPWKQIIRSGTTTGHRRITAKADNYQWCTDWGTPYSAFNDWIITENDVSSFVHTSRNLAQDAAARIYASRFDALTFLVELTSVKEMFFDIGKRLVQIQKRIIQNHMRKGKASLLKDLRTLSCDWLSYRYGWRTLFMDLQDLNELIQELMAGPRRSRFSETVRDITTERTLDQRSVEYVYYFADVTVEDTVRVSHMGSVTADIQLQDVQMNPLMTAWEIVPYSFVIDWFLGVGKSIAAAAFLSTSTEWAASQGYQVIFNRAVSVSLGQTKPNFVSGFHNQTSAAEMTINVRNPCSIPIIPQFQLNIDALKVIDLVAMIYQQLKFRR